jgi:hypothetical protein
VPTCLEELPSISLMQLSCVHPILSMTLKTKKGCFQISFPFSRYYICFCFLKKRIHKLCLRYFLALQKHVPPAEPDMIVESAEEIKKNWQVELERISANKTCITTIITNTVSSFVEVKATFAKRHFYAEQPLEVSVHIR